MLKHLVLIRIQHMMDINVNLLQKSSDTHKETGINSNVVSKSKQLAKDLHKPIIRNQ